MLEIGEALRTGRARAGLRLTDVETATRIPLPFLQALEEERFDRLPAGFYRRSYLREYAAFLGLDAERCVDAYEERFAPPDPDVVPALAPIARPSPLRALRSPAALVALVAVAIAGAGIWRLSTGGGSGTHTPPAQHVAGARTPPTTPAAVVPALPATAASLTLKAARGSCWLLVRVGSKSGPIAYERTLKPGGHVRFGLRKPLWITVGAPWNLEAAIGGRTVTPDLPTATGVVIARRAGIASTA